MIINCNLLLKNAANGQQLTLSYLYDMQSKTVNSVKNGQKQFKIVKNCQKRSKMPIKVRHGAENVRHSAENVHFEPLS